MSCCSTTAISLLPRRTIRQGLRAGAPPCAASRRTQAALACLLWGLALATAHANSPGQALYQRGLLPSGEPVHALREGNASIQGSDAACANCHRRSGLGSSEGVITIPPIAGPYLFAPHGRSLERLGIPFVDTERLEHEPYTDETLARAIRDGIGANGHPLNYLMPHYALDDASMGQLIGYLKGMNVTGTPGVSATVLHFATIITPDADPLKRQGMLDVLNQYFSDKNSAVARTKAPTLYSSHRTGFRVERRWQLHVWQLTGSASTWQMQLQQHLAEEPVFAVISGLGGSTWEPVHRFCEQQALPCLFPNIEAPSGQDDDFYSLYFSRGVLLEAQLIAQQLAAPDASLRRIVQVYRAADVGEQAARQLQAAHAANGLKIVNRMLKAHAAAGELAAALQDVAPNDALILWLRPTDLESLQRVPQKTKHLWISGEMGDLERAPLPPAWRADARMAYPVDLPSRRVVRVDYALSWFRIRKIPVSAQKVQVDTYLACGLVSETLNHMVDAFVRDYLIERLEMMLDHRALTGYYPRLTLAPGQRFASKGGYIVRFTDPHEPKVAAVSDWITPEATAPQPP
jgi:hypothetical protein